MKRNKNSNPTVQVISLQSYNPWLWISLTMVMLAFFSISIASCSTTPVARAEVQIGLADEISVDEAYELYREGVYFLDVRTPEEWDEFHAPDSTLIPLDELENRLGELPKGESIVVVCRSGNRSQVGRDILKANGYEETTSMAGGFREWMASGYPVE
jgi:rhodanese-related sulfurtransferase